MPLAVMLHLIHPPRATPNRHWLRRSRSEQPRWRRHNLLLRTELLPPRPHRQQIKPELILRPNGLKKPPRSWNKHRKIIQKPVKKKPMKQEMWPIVNLLNKHKPEYRNTKTMLLMTRILKIATFC